MVSRRVAFGCGLLAMALVPAAAQAQIGITAIPENKADFPSVQINNNFSSTCVPAIQRALAHVSNAATSDGRRSTFKVALLPSYWTAYGWNSSTGRSTVPNNHQYSVIFAKPGSAMKVAGRLAETGLLLVKNPDGQPKAFPDGFHFYNHGDMEFNQDVFYFNTGKAGGGFHCPATSSPAPSDQWSMDNVAAHEAAHWSGMNHNPSYPTLMYREFSQTDVNFKTMIPLNDEEVATMIRLYGQR